MTRRPSTTGLASSTGYTARETGASERAGGEALNQPLIQQLQPVVHASCRGGLVGTAIQAGCGLPAHLGQLDLAADAFQQAQQKLGALEALLVQGGVGRHSPAGQAVRQR